MSRPNNRCFSRKTHEKMKTRFNFLYSTTYEVVFYIFYYTTYYTMAALLLLSLIKSYSCPTVEKTEFLWSSCTITINSHNIFEKIEFYKQENDDLPPQEVYGCPLKSIFYKLEMKISNLQKNPQFCTSFM